MRLVAQRCLLAISLSWALSLSAEAQRRPPTRLNDPAQQAQRCMANGDNACVVRLLSGRANSAPTLSMLAQAQRETTGPSSACPTLTQLLEQFPQSAEAGRWRSFHASTCTAGPLPVQPADPERAAAECMANGDNLCVLRILGGGRARTARALGFLGQAQREVSGDASACPTIRELLERFPRSAQAGRWRRFHTLSCQ